MEVQIPMAQSIQCYIKQNYVVPLWRQEHVDMASNVSLLMAKRSSDQSNDIHDIRRRSVRRLHRRGRVSMGADADSFMNFRGNCHRWKVLSNNNRRRRRQQWRQQWRIQHRRIRQRDCRCLLIFLRIDGYCYLLSTQCFDMSEKRGCFTLLFLLIFILFIFLQVLYFWVPFLVQLGITQTKMNGIFEICKR